MSSQKVGHHREDPITEPKSDASIARRDLGLLRELEKALDQTRLAASRLSPLSEEESKQLHLKHEDRSGFARAKSAPPLPPVANPPLTLGLADPSAERSRPSGSPPWKPMPSELPRREPYSLREALNRIETGPSPAPEFLRARSGAHRPDQRPPQRDGERPFEAPPAARRPSKPGMQRRRDPAFREMAQTGDEAPAGTKKARKAKPKPGRLTIAGYILLVGIAAGGLTFALVEVIETRAFTATGGEDKRGMTAPGGVHGGRQLAKDAPQLKLSALSGTANRPIPLGVDVNSPTQGLFVLVHGMPAGSRLTAGLQIRDGEWRVPLRDLLHAQVMPPQDYLGTLNLPVDLSNSDGRVIESKIQRLTWGADRPDPIVAKPVETVVVGSQSGSSPPGHSASQNVRQALAGDGPVQSFGERPVTSPRAESSQASRQIDAQELKNLMQRAETALENRDFAAARLLLRRAAEAGDPKAAIALAATYDPRVLKQLGALGAQANADRAREWYRKAADWGSPEAGRRLLELQQSPH